MNHKNINMKIFHNNIKNNSKNILLRSKKESIGNTKYYPSFSKEWRNIIYSYNKNNLKNLPINDVNINKIVQSYFDLFFKNQDIISLDENKRSTLIRKRRKFLRRIFVSNVEIKHTNNKAKVTLYTINREKSILKNKYINLYKELSLNIFESYIYLYKKCMNNISLFLNNKYKGRNEYFFESDFVRKSNYIKHKLNYLQVFLKLKNLILRKTWSLVIQSQSSNYIDLLRKYNLFYSLNQFKFNKLILLPKLSNLLSKIIGKKLEYNIINLKSISYNTDIFTKILALKVNKIKAGHVNKMLSVLNKAYLPKVNTIQERTKIQTIDNLDSFQNKYKDLKILSNIHEKENISELLTTIHKDTNDSNKIHNSIYNSIGYKNMSGIKIEVKGRLTKRYRADRAVYSLRQKGGLKNINSSFKGLSSVLFRGNTNSNVSYSWMKSKRRVGAFAVKGWIGGK